MARQPLSADAWSNWGWRYPNVYAPPGPTTTGLEQSQPAMTVQNQPGMPSTGFQMPTQVPYDQSLVNQMLMQQYQAQLQPWQTTESKTQGANLGMEYANKLGLTTPAEPDPSMEYRVKSSMADALRNVQGQTARSGMSLSSVRDTAQENVIQQALETLMRENQAASERKKTLAAQFVSGMAR